MFFNSSYTEYTNTFFNVNETLAYLSLTPVISDEVRLWMERTMAVMMLFFNTMGVVANVINIRVFIHQGVSGNSITISFLALAIADFGCALTMLPYSICYIMEFIGYEVIAHNCSTFHVLITWQGRLLFAKLSCWITVYISLERSISVIMPLKVKTMFKPRTAVYAMIAIYTCISLAHLCRPFPTFRWKYSSKFNQTIAVFYSSPAANRAILVINMIFHTITPSFLIVFFTVSLGLMIHKLNAHRDFRLKLTTKVNETNDDNQAPKGGKKRDTEILKAIALVTGVFLFCSIMSYIPGLAISIVPGAKLGQVNENLNMVSYVFKSLFDSINSSVNLFIYLNVSTNYREAFNRVFKKR